MEALLGGWSGSPAFSEGARLEPAHFPAPRQPLTRPPGLRLHWQLGAAQPLGGLSSPRPCWQVRAASCCQGPPPLSGEEIQEPQAQVKPSLASTTWELSRVPRMAGREIRKAKVSLGGGGQAQRSLGPRMSCEWSLSHERTLPDIALSPGSSEPRRGS